MSRIDERAAFFLLRSLTKLYVCGKKLSIFQKGKNPA
jgi:hypothetical protein